MKLFAADAVASDEKIGAVSAAEVLTTSRQVVDADVTFATTVACWG